MNCMDQLGNYFDGKPSSKLQNISFTLSPDNLQQTLLGAFHQVTMTTIWLPWQRYHTVTNTPTPQLPPWELPPWLPPLHPTRLLRGVYPPHRHKLDSAPRPLAAGVYARPASCGVTVGARAAHLPAGARGMRLFIRSRSNCNLLVAASCVIYEAV